MNATENSRKDDRRGEEDVQNISDIMRTLKRSHRERQKVKDAFLSSRNHSIQELCDHILRRMVDPELPALTIPKQNAPSTKMPPTPNGAEAMRMVTLFTKEMKARTAFDEVCVECTEKAFTEYMLHAKVTDNWKAKRFEEIEKKRQKWYDVADNTAALQQERVGVNRAKLEEEWQSMIEKLPNGTQKQLLRNYQIPITDRAQLCGMDVNDSIFSRMRDQEKDDSKQKDVHWRLRNIVDDVTQEFKNRVEVSFASSRRVVAQNVVQQAKMKIGAEERKLRVIMTSLRSQMDVVQSMMLKNATDRSNAEAELNRLRQSVEAVYSRDKAMHYNRLANLR